MFATIVVPELLTPCSIYSPKGNCPLCVLLIPKSAIDVPVLSSKSIGPPSILVSFKNLPVVALVLKGIPVTLESPAKGTLLLESLVTLVIVIALPFDSVNCNLPSPNISVVKFGILNASIVDLISELFAMPAPYCALPLGLVVTLAKNVPLPVVMFPLKGTYPSSNP